MNAAVQQAPAPVWDNVQEQLRGLLGEDTYGRWFQTVTASIEEADGVYRLHIAAPDRFQRDWLRDHYGSIIEALWRNVEPTGTIIFTVQEQQAPALEKFPAKVIQLPLWPEAQRGVPNDILRSALFAAIQGKGRKFVKQRTIAAYNGVRIKYTGEQLEQSDLDVWEQILHLARQHPLGTACHFAAYGFLKTLERRTGNKDYKWLHGVLLRLRSCTVEIYKDRHIYARGLVEKFDIDEVTRHFKVAIDPDMMEVYTAGWTGIDWDKRQQLRGKPLALWLYGYYASHAAPLPVKVDTLRTLSGSRTAELWKFRQLLKTALKELERIHAIEAWDIDENDLVHVHRGKAVSDSQHRHLIRTKPPGRRQTQTRDTR